MTRFLGIFKQSVTLHDMVKSRLVVSVCRAKDVFEQVPAEQLVPGDVIEIPGGHESTMACDAILLNGNCIVNESMLTGNLNGHDPLGQAFFLKRTFDHF